RRMFPAQYLQPHSGKLLYFLFEPPFAQARNDPRFAALAERLGLAAFWRAAATRPDFMRG
ncbi:MAG: hypothetical protein ACREBO_03430, partial [Novosphingobium sp.]